MSWFVYLQISKNLTVLSMWGETRPWVMLVRSCEDEPPLSAQSLCVNESKGQRGHTEECSHSRNETDWHQLTDWAVDRLVSDCLVQNTQWSLATELVHQPFSHFWLLDAHSTENLSVWHLSPSLSELHLKVGSFCVFLINIHINQAHPIYGNSWWL